MSAGAHGAPAGGLTVDRAIDDRPLSLFQVLVIVQCALVLLLDGFDIQAMALAVPSISAEWGVAPEAFGPALSASLFGILIATFIGGPLGDLIGRKPVMLGAFALVGVSTLMVAHSASPEALTFWRFLTGIGLGAGMPNAYALTTEISPARRRSSMLIIMASTVALGAMLAGIVAPFLIELGGWRLIFYVGGIPPLVLAALLIFTLPESPRLLAARRWGDPRIARALRRIAPDLDPALLVPDVKEPAVAAAAANMPGAPAARRSWGSFALRLPMVQLFSDRFRNATLMLWGSYSLLAFVLYMLISWLPTLLSVGGWTQSQALYGAALLQLGGIIGGLAYSVYVDKGKVVQALLTAMAIAAVSISLFQVAPPTFLIWGGLLVLLGVGLSGSMFALIAVCGGVYPPSMRATGLAYMAGVSRFASALSPMVGAAMLAMGYSPVTVMTFLIAPILLAALASVLLPRVLPKP